MTFRTFPTAFKLAAIKRLEAGEAVLPLARELGVSRKLLHDWRKAWGLHGPAGLNRKRGSKPGPHKLRPLAGATRMLAVSALPSLAARWLVPRCALLKSFLVRNWCGPRPAIRLVVLAVG
jgi:hypothetical protein